MNPGFGAGRGPGRVDDAPALGAGSAWAVGASKAGVATGGMSVCGARVGASTAAWGAETAAEATWDRTSCLALSWVAGGAGVGLPAFFAGDTLVDSFSLSRLSTGASTVEEADRTNSPMSFNIVRTILLSTPSSFASS